ncbi:serine/threonine-protein kinase [Amycolatopsis sp. NPDC059657]|uniref:serine/threonine-protein kinase n=1 Tax=Amycolatopsis sp. NPDC059657 TaxID=3346899 RepID=UPI003672623C
MTWNTAVEGNVRAGEVVGDRYRLEEEIGSGSNGVVWLATDEQLGRSVALKRSVSGDMDEYAERVRQLRREARLLAQLNHRNVVTLHDVVDADHECWLVLEYVAARSMADRGVLPPLLAAKLGAQIADALAAVHAKGILHRDIKPANILMPNEDEAKLADFGISRFLAGAETITGSALIAGTPGYVAPEVANGADPTMASDVFSLGAALFTAVEGKSPVGGKDDNAFVRLRRAAAGQIAVPSGPLGPVLARLLEVDPAKRPTAAEAHRLLAEVAGMTPTRRAYRSRRTVRRGLVAGGVLVVVVATTAWLVFSSGPPLTTSQDGPLIGDPRLVDPCPMIDSEPIWDLLTKAGKRPGSINLVSDVDSFNQCDVITKWDGGDEVDVQVQFLYAEMSESVRPQAENHGRYSVVRSKAGERTCVRSVLLPGGYEIRIHAFPKAGTKFADLCGMADAVTGSVTRTLDKGPVPVRGKADDPLSLITTDACKLQNPSALTMPAGFDIARSTPGFAHWSCEWRSKVDSSLLRLVFLRRTAFKAGDATMKAVAGHATVQDTEDDDGKSCGVKVYMNFVYVREFGDGWNEVVYVHVTGTEPAERRCELAAQLATAWFPPR